MSEPSTIFLTERSLIADGGTSIILENYGTISSIAVTSENAAETPALQISNYDRSTPNSLLNANFESGDLTSWSSSGTATVETGDFPGLSFLCNISNLSQISQTITGFNGKNPVLSFAHIGPELIISLNLLDVSNVLIASQNKVIPASDIWVVAEFGYYCEDVDVEKAQCIFYSDNNNAKLTKVVLQGVEDFSGMTFGDEYLTTRNSISASTGKFFIGDGTQLSDARSELLDVRGSGFFSGDLNVNGSINANIVYPQISLQPFATNIIFSSSSGTNIVWSSGLIEFVSTHTFGIVSGSATISTLTYFFLDSDVSTTVLQSSTVYTDCLGNNRVLIASAQNSATGNASIKVYSGQQSLINGANQITAASIVNSNLSVNSVTASNIVASTITADKLNITTLSAVNSNMGTLTAGIITLSGAGSYLNFGTTPPTSSSGSGGTSGLFQDYTGLYSLSGTTLNVSLTALGLNAGNIGDVILNSTGLSLSVPNSYTDNNAVKFTKSGIVEAYLSVYDDGATGASATFALNTGSTGTNASYGNQNALVAISKAGFDSEVLLMAERESGRIVQFVLKDINSGQSIILSNNTKHDVDFVVNGLGLEIARFDAANLNVGVGTATPDTSSILDLTSTTSGFLSPRMTTTQRDAISSPATGLEIYNTTTNKKNFYDGGTWRVVTST